MTTEHVWLPEHACNPFIVGLGPPPDTAAAIALLNVAPVFSEDERSLPPHLRRYCALRLAGFIHPRVCQIELVERIGMVMRQGYIGRNPADGRHHAAILDAADRRAAGDVGIRSSRGVVPTAAGFALIGHPGMGKTLTIERILGSYPELIEPRLQESVLQVPWLKVECPSGGTRKQFCIAFLAALGLRVGRNYVAEYVGARSVADTLMLVVQQLCQVHALGVLVVDEIQHLAKSKEGVEQLMNYLVTLVNTIGVPVVLVGTMAATFIIEKDFREARRAAGLGQPTWFRQQRGEEWDGFVKAIWRYQWTRNPVPYSPAISEVLYHESQGIMDIAVKLVMVAQFRAIWRGEAVAGADDAMTPGLLSQVAADDFRVIRPMMDALRDGREDVLTRYDDLAGFHAHVDSILSSASGMTMEQFRAARGLTQTANALRVSSPEDPLSSVRAVLAHRGLAADLIETLIAEALRRHPSADPLTMMPTLIELLEGRLETPPEVRRGSRRPAARSSATRERDFVPLDDPDDLRVVAAAARAAGRSIHDAFVERGLTATVLDIVAA